MNEHKFTEADFTEDELMLLKMAFSLADNVVNTFRTDNYDVYLSNTLYYLEEKLGISNIVQILTKLVMEFIDMNSVRRDFDIDKEIEKFRQYDVYDEEDLESRKNEWMATGLDSKASELLALASYWNQQL